MRSLRYLNTILTLIALLLTLNLWTVWTAGPSSESLSIAAPARAADAPKGVGSTAARQKQMIEELKTINQTVAALDKTLTSGQVRVKVEGQPAKK